LAIDTFGLSFLALGPPFALFALSFIFRERPVNKGIFHGFGFDMNICSLGMLFSVSLQAFSQNNSDLEIIHFFVFVFEFIIMAAIGRLMPTEHQDSINILGFVGIVPAFLWVLHVILATAVSS